MEGISTYVYRIACQGEIFYLRVLPEEDASFASEVTVHTQLRRGQVKVPDIIYFEHCNDLLQRSIMVTTEIKGQPISDSYSLSKEALEGILIEAGQDLARINSVTVEGYGWIKRGRGDGECLHAQWPVHRSFALEFWEVDLAYLRNAVLTASEIVRLECVLARYNDWLDVEQGYLAHGDLDATHIYQEDGQYSGIIDFGEIRGASRYYDLGYFHMRDGERVPARLAPSLIHGYREIVPLPSGYDHRVCFASLLINIRALARSLQKRPANQYTSHQLQVLREDLAFLL